MKKMLMTIGIIMLMVMLLGAVDSNVQEECDRTALIEFVESKGGLIIGDPNAQYLMFELDGWGMGMDQSYFRRGLEELKEDF